MDVLHQDNVHKIIHMDANLQNTSLGATVS